MKDLHFLKDYGRAVHAECLKVHRTPALLLALVAPYGAVMLTMMMAYTNGHKFLNSENCWTWLSSNSLILWTAALMPIWIGLETEFLADLEVRNTQWKHLFALPVSRAALYGAKLTMAALLLVLSYVVMTFSVAGAGLFLGLVRPKLGYTEAMPQLGDWAYGCGVLFVATLLLLAIHTWLSLRFKSFVPGIVVAALATGGAGVLTAYQLWPYFPWRLTLNVMNELGSRSVDPVWLWASVGGTLVCTVAGAWDVSRRDIL